MINIVQLYTFFFFIIFVLRVIFKWQETPPLFYVTIVLIDLIAFIGLIGLSFKKLYFRDWFWKIFLFVFIALETVIIILMKFEHFWQLMYSIALILPAHYSIYVYAFKSNWKVKDTLIKQARQKKGELDDTDRSGS